MAMATMIKVNVTASSFISRASKPPGSLHRSCFRDAVWRSGNNRMSIRCSAAEEAFPSSFKHDAPKIPKGNNPSLALGQVWVGRSLALVISKWILYYALQASIIPVFQLPAKLVQTVLQTTFLNDLLPVVGAFLASYLSVFLGSIVVLTFGRSPVVDLKLLGRKSKNMVVDRREDARELKEKLSSMQWPCVLHANPTSGASTLLQCMAAQGKGVTYVRFDEFSMGLVAGLCFIFGFGWMSHGMLTTLLQVSGCISSVITGQTPILVLDGLKDATVDDFIQLMTLGEDLRGLVTLVLLVPSSQLSTIIRSDSRYTRFFIEPIPEDSMVKLMQSKLPNVQPADIQRVVVMAGGNFFHTHAMLEEVAAGRDPEAWYQNWLDEQYSHAGMLCNNKWVLAFFKRMTTSTEPVPLEDLHGMMSEKQGISPLINRGRIFKRDADNRISFISPAAYQYAAKLVAILEQAGATQFRQVQTLEQLVQRTSK